MKRQRAAKQPLSIGSRETLVAGITMGRSLKEIERLGGVVAGPVVERFRRVRVVMDCAELHLVAALYQRAMAGDREAAKYILITRFGYSIHGNPPPKAAAPSSVCIQIEDPPA